MKICFLSTGFPRSREDSYAPFLYTLASDLSNSNKLTVIAASGIDTIDDQIIDNLHIHRFRYFFPKNKQILIYTGGMYESVKKSFLAKLQVPLLTFSCFFKSLVYCKDQDIIHAFFTLPGFVAVLIKKVYKIPVVLDIPGTDLRSMPKWLNRFVVKNVDFVITYSPELTDLLNNLGRTKNFLEIPQPVDDSKFNPNIDTKKIKEEFKIKNEFIVAFVGRFEGMKDPLTFIKAIPYVIERYNKNIKFIIVGDGHLKQQVLNLIKKLKIQKYLIYPGARSDVNQIYNLANIFVATSPLENIWSTTVIEAAKCKTPMILTSAGYTTKVFTHLENAFIIPPKDEKKLAQAILTLIESKKLRDHLANNAFNLINKKILTKEKRKEVLINIYESCIKNNIAK